MSLKRGWKDTCIDDICESIIDCVNKTAPTVDYVTPYKMIRTTNVRNGWIDLASVKYVEKPIYEKWTRRQVPQKGDVILTREAPLGEVGMLRKSDSVFLGQRLVSYRADPERLDNRFLLYAFQGEYLQSQIRALGSGATVEHMRVPDAKRLRVLLPPLRTQLRIASILSAYDDLIENNTRRIEILEEMARRLYEEWFVHFRFPGHEEVRFKESELGRIPEGWECMPFTALADVLSGGTPKKSEERFWGGSIPFFTPRDAPSAYYVSETASTITDMGLAKCNSKLYPKDTVFITARGTVGKTALAPCDMAMNQSCYALRAKNGFGQFFLFLAIREAVCDLKNRSHGAVFDTIIVDTFRQISVIIPDLEVAHIFEDKVRPIFDLVLSLQKKNSNLRAQRDLLLPKLVSGEIDVSHIPLPDDKEVEAA
ncbi:MAG: restriction endonuclease subunit S [Ectothiorhodospiraceae bacterium]|nr:restriction endonuclease subunit S [Ectothiorhodospiraceae bacterium]